MTNNTDPEFHRWLGRMDSKLDAILDTLARQHERLDSHSDRIGRLERGRAWLVGAATAVATAFGFAVQYIFPFLKSQ